MLRYIGCLCVVGVMLSVCSTKLEAQNLVQNGSFELGAFVPNANASMSLPSGSDTMTGWTTFNAELAWIDDANNFNPYVFASEGTKHLDLAGYHDSSPYGGVQQSITTNVGQRYIMSLDLGTNPFYGVTQSLVASAGGESRNFTLSATGGTTVWQRYEFEFTASTQSTLISIVGDSPSGAHIGLDNISVSVVPAPSALTAFIIGAVPGMRILLRRRNRK